MLKVYIVYGDAGDYGDYAEWPICGYFDKDKAARHVELATAAEAKIIEKARESGKHFYWIKDINPYDPRPIGATSPYNRPRYTVAEIEMREDIPDVG